MEEFMDQVNKREAVKVQMKGLIDFANWIALNFPKKIKNMCKKKLAVEISYGKRKRTLKVKEYVKVLMYKWDRTQLIRRDVRCRALIDEEKEW
jgi:hypothetical protein